MEKGRRLTGARNSPLRDLASKLSRKPAALLRKAIPGIKPDHITVLGLFSTLLGSALKTIPPEKLILSEATTTTVAFLALLLGGYADVVDGEMARQLKTDSSSTKGANWDVLTDRIGESAMALSSIAQATTRGVLWDVVAAAPAVITGRLPSLYRAKVEELGFIVPETGKNLTSFFGARLSRVASGMATTASPTPFDLPFQPLMDSASAISNFVLWQERSRILKEAKKGLLEPNPEEKDKQLGREKSKILKGFAFANAGLMIIAGIYAGLNTVSH